uniref:Integrase catalytic domain-containing protein n=1 Tax=Mesocestoides corti TaxID=53468 RepID=A0A5K3FT47_MESCO
MDPDRGHQESNKVSPVPWPQAQKPWSNVHFDFSGLIKGGSYLVLVDVFSKLPESVPMHCPTTTNTMQALSSISNQHGIPEIIVSDTVHSAFGWDSKGLSVRGHVLA